MAAADALDHLRRLELHGAPVVDEDGRPVGVVTTTDLVGHLDGVSVSDRMSVPVDIVPATAPVADVARSLVESGRHHVVVVQGDRAVGFVSAVDLLAGILGMSPHRPASFPYGADAQGLHWSEPCDFSAEAAESVAPQAGLLVLVHGGAFRHERVVWVEAADDLRARLLQLADRPSSRPDDLTPWFGWGCLRFCTAEVPDADARSRALQAVQTWRDGNLEPVIHELLGHRRVD
jgi:CBS domain-containing protein